MSRSAYSGRHEIGQNFLNHTPTISYLVTLVSKTSGSILEIGAGQGALTVPLSKLDRPVTAIDIDRKAIHRLRRRVPQVRCLHADILSHTIHDPVLVGNVPFNITTPILRKLLTSTCWRDAFLVLQWEVARKRAGVGGGTMMSAQHGPWFAFTLHGRIPARCFAPRPSVDAGILHIARRNVPLIADEERGQYQHFVHSVFTGKGRNMVEIVSNATQSSHREAGRILQTLEIPASSKPRDLWAEQWASLWPQTH
ncbi:23S ribosomal RNA methyltransferase Erm [Actinomycetaceae bacterium WB03_NA08]|uniref:23S ribosomal RNA methyltransferase Erm n=1 Tax=Scrofimicrobium canadense TaxID=2652290 RepID=A0A6N7VSX9_9ACTO|nr:23S ribosomal RNA methyltransferase Erm [Scrofimicrobium canadense]MSS84050.1 23S ribosomal RNA methyltransferase Erm [Scrofimicrobium canadense]